jgi:hypothetical protein
MPRKIASRKNENPSMAKPSPKTPPNVAVKFGHSTPISKLNTVPVIAPIANRAIITRLHRRAIVRHSGSPVRCPHHSMSSTITGKAMPKHTSGMWAVNDSACICRAWSR